MSIKTGNVSRRYGGSPAAQGLRTPSEYYLVTQVRAPRAAAGSQVGTLRSLRLGRLGRRVIVPNRPELVGAIQSVSHLLSLQVVDDPADIPGVRVLGAKPRTRKHTRVTWGQESPDRRRGAGMKPLQDALEDLHRLVRPDLNEKQLKATAAAASRILGADPKRRLSASQKRELRASVQAQIERFASP